MTQKTSKILSPYIAGIIIGIIVVINMIIIDDYYKIIPPLTQPSTENIELIEGCENSLKCIKGNYNPKHRYIAYLPLLAGLFFGAFIASIRAKTFSLMWSSEFQLKDIFKKPVKTFKVFSAAFIGGFLIQFGAYYISGSAFGIWAVYGELMRGSLYSLIIIAFIFLGGICGTAIFRGHK